MSNIFLTIDKINALLNNKALSSSQIKILQQLLNGNEHHLGLIKLAQNNNPAQLKIIEQELSMHLQSISSIDFFYKRAIKSIHKDIKVICHYAEDIIKALGLNKSTDTFKRYAKRHDDIFAITQKSYAGTVMLPVIQCIDFRLSNSKGECSGYVLEWIQSLLNNKKPFGVAFLEAPPFLPIALNSKLGRRYPELNHCAPLTKTIADLQNLDYRFASKKLAHEHQRAIYQHPEGGSLISKDISQLILELINSSNHNPGSAYYISLKNYAHGHALGFYKDKLNQFHFLDVNSGWYRFNAEADFMSWLKFYFKTMSYDIKYRVCEFYSFGFQKKEHSFFKTAWNTFALFTKSEMTIDFKP